MDYGTNATECAEGAMEKLPCMRENEQQICSGLFNAKS